MISRRRKFARVKSRKSLNIKRPKIGGGKIKLYAILSRYNEARPEVQKPKCIIIQMPKILKKDDLYLFFDAALEPTEIKDIIYAALGLDAAAKINPELVINTNKFKEFNDLYIKLNGGILDYDLESGLLSNNFTSETTHISPKKLTKREDVIENLRRLHITKPDYVFERKNHSTIFTQFLANNDIGSDKISWKSIIDLYRYIKEQAIEYNSLRVKSAEKERQEAERRRKEYLARLKETDRIDPQGINGRAWKARVFLIDEQGHQVPKWPTMYAHYWEKN
jgi:hypothetical protein